MTPIQSGCLGLECSSNDCILGRPDAAVDIGLEHPCRLRGVGLDNFPSTSPINYFSRFEEYWDHGTVAEPTSTVTIPLVLMSCCVKMSQAELDND